MKTTWKMALVLMSMFFLAGLTACDQAEKKVDELTEVAKQTVETAKDKAVEVLEGTDKKESEEKPAEEREGEGEKKE